MQKVMQNVEQGSHSPGKPGKLLEICQPGKLVEFYVRPAIFGMISRFMLVLTLVAISRTS